MAFGFRRRSVCGKNEIIFFVRLKPTEQTQTGLKVVLVYFHLLRRIILTDLIPISTP